MPATGLLLWLIGLGQVGTVPATPPPAMPETQAQILATFPHDKGAYTEGLFWHDGFLYESTGQTGASSIRKVRLKDGKVMMRVSVNPPYYGEGIALWRDQILSLTWQEQTGFRWALKDFKKIGKFSYPGEGWALTTDGDELIMSDGTPILRVIDPATFTVKRTIAVNDRGIPLPNLNEIEMVDGEILANVWLTDEIARIDPRDGHVIGWINVAELHRQSGATDENSVANGIAWDAKGRHLYVTGKNWPYMFEIRAPKDVAATN